MKRILNKIIKFFINEKLLGNMYIYNTIIYFSLVMLSLSTYMQIYLLSYFIRMLIKFSLCFSLFLSILSLSTNKHENKIRVFLSIFLVLLIYNYYLFKNGNILVLVCYAINSYLCDYRKMAKILFYTYSFTFAFIVLSCIIGIINDSTFIQVRHGIETARHSLGFNYANTGSHYLFVIVLLHYIYKNNKLNVLYSIFYIIISYIVYKLTDTKSSFALVILSILFFTFARLINNIMINKICILISKYIFIIVTFIAIFLFVYYYYRFPHFDKINSLVSGRLGLELSALKAYKISIFGAKPNVDLLPTGYFYLDSGIFSVLLNFGILIFSFLISFYTMFINKCIKIGLIPITISLIIIALHSIFDASFELLNFSPFVLFFGNIYYSSER